MYVLFGFIIILLWLWFFVCLAFLWWRIVEKTGYHGAWGLLIFVPDSKYWIHRFFSSQGMAGPFNN